jgi:hypothetical protein
MQEQAIKASIREAIEEAIAEFGIDNLKTTSMFPLSRRRAARTIRKAA